MTDWYHASICDYVIYHGYDWPITWCYWIVPGTLDIAQP